MAWHRAHRPYWRAYKTVWAHRTRTKRRIARRRWGTSPEKIHPPQKRPFASVPSPAVEISFVPASRTQEAAYLIFLVDAPRTTVLRRVSTRSEAEGWARDHGYAIL